MSTRRTNETHYENHARAAELLDRAAHAHRVGEQHGDQDHLTGHEHSRLAQEHSQTVSQPAPAGHVHPFGHEEIAALAYELWQARGCPIGSPDEDWYHAAEHLRSHSYTR